MQAVETNLSGLSAWVQHINIDTVFSSIADACGSNALVILNKEQKVLLWGLGAEILSGLKAVDVIDKPCIDEWQIDIKNEVANQSSTQRIQFKRADGAIIEADKMTQIFFDHQGAFAGGVVVLMPAPDTLDKQMQIDTMSGAKLINFHGIISRSPTMRPVFQLVQNAAKTEATVLVRGESGSGKELIAHAIHDLSLRRDAPFLAVNCAALSDTLLESELFGHVRGAFTGATRDHRGLFERAHKGTLFLDEVAEMPLQLQAKLLRVIQERNFIPVGATKTVEVDVRLVAATHRSLREEVKDGSFREDLMYRLRVVPIFIPPLRERREDISVLLWHFIHQHNQQGLRQIDKIDPLAMRVLLDYSWPGNIRELQNVVEYSFAVGRGAVLRILELPPEFREAKQEVVGKVKTDLNIISPDQEEAAISEALAQSHGRVGAAANALGLSRATFWRKRKKYGL